jgi:hypothetical protein
MGEKNPSNPSIRPGKKKLQIQTPPMLYHIMRKESDQLETKYVNTIIKQEMKEDKQKKS